MTALKLKSLHYCEICCDEAYRYDKHKGAWLCKTCYECDNKTLWQKVKNFFSLKKRREINNLKKWYSTFGSGLF
jgi:23S rRNA U2552 (ribose-2'-O)-methylase RlmE/FtsJ